MKSPFAKVGGNRDASCRLCQSQAKLCASHVVPEFCYSYDESGKSRFALATLVPAASGAPRMMKVQKGYREYLLCPQCEQVLCAHEARFSLLWRRVLSQAPFTVGQAVEVHGADYHSTKMLLLSVFWRASVSLLFGQSISLGPYSEKLREILLDNRRVRQDQYPLLGVLILDSLGNPLNGCVTQPVLTRFGHVRAYAMHFGGCRWTLVMSDHFVPRELQPLQHVVGEDDRLLLVTQHHTEDRFLRMMGQRLRDGDS